MSSNSKHSGKNKTGRPGRRSLALGLAFALCLALPAEAQKSGGASDKPAAAAPAIARPAAIPAPDASQGSPPSALPNKLQNISVGSDAEFTRLVFTFTQPLGDYVLRRDDANVITLDFGRATADGVASPAPASMIERVELKNVEGRLTAKVTLASMRYELRHFPSRDRYSCIVDLRNLESQLTPDGDDEGEIAAPQRLKVPTLEEYAAELAARHPLDSTPGPDGQVFQRALAALEKGRTGPALSDLKLIEQKYPQSPLGEPTMFLLGELYAETADDGNLSPAVEAWKRALNTYPQSEEAPRAAYLSAQATLDQGQRNEAAALFKLAAEGYPEGPYMVLSTLKAADLKMQMGEIGEARELLEPLLTEGLSGRPGLEAYARLGMADFLEGLYSQANEIFREILDRAPRFYEEYPEILYAIGEAYHYLNRPDLSRIFLLHALNLMPDNPKVDVMMTRVGDDYRKEGRVPEAISMYKAAARRFPNGDGGVISQMRLADMGALHSFFDGRGNVFNVLENGSREATMAMYKRVVDSGSSSPLLQLAYLKIGQAAAGANENGEAIRWLRDLVVNYPRSSLLPEAAPTLSRAIVAEAAQRYELGDWQAISDLYADNSSYLQGADVPKMHRMLASAYEKLGRLAEANQVWKALEEETPEKRLTRAKNLVANSLMLGNPLEAMEYVGDVASEFPGERDWVEMQLDQIGSALANPDDPEAVAKLLRFHDAVSEEALRRRALADAVSIEGAKGSQEKAAALMDQYRQEFPQDELSGTYLLAQAEIDRAQKRYDKAWERLTLFRLTYPEDERGRESLLRQISDAVELGRQADALRFMELYRGVYPDDLKSRDLLAQRVEELWQSGDYDGAEASAMEFAGAYPEDVLAGDVLLKQVERAWAAGRLAPYQALLKTFRDKLPDDPRVASTYLDEYRKYSGVGDIEAAFKVADEFRAKMPDSPSQSEVLLEKARDLFKIGRPADGLAAWTTFREKYPNDPRTSDLLLIQARQELKEKMTDAALGHYKEFLAKYPDSPKMADVTLELASAMNDAGKLDEAYAFLGEFLEKHPGHPMAPKAALDQIAIGTAMGKIKENIEHYKEFRDKYSNSPEYSQTYLAEARLEVTAGLPDEAMRTLEEGILMVPALERDPQVLSLLSDLYLDSGRIEDWARNMERALALAPPDDLEDRFLKYNQLAQVYMALGRQTEAERNYDAALANRPPEATPETLYAIAGFYKKIGRTEKYVQALQLVRDSGDSFWAKVADEEMAAARPDAPLDGAPAEPGPDSPAPTTSTP